MRFFNVFIIMLFITACGHSYTQANSLEQNAWDSANQRMDELGEQCIADRKSGKIKTYYAANECQIEAIEQTILPFFVKKEAFSDYKTQRLLLALKVEKKQMDKQEANLIINNLYDKMIAAQQNTLEQMRVQNPQPRHSPESTAMLGFIGAVQDKIEQRKVPVNIPPPAIKTECSTYYGKTTCYTDR